MATRKAKPIRKRVRGSNTLKGRTIHWATRSRTRLKGVVNLARGAIQLCDSRSGGVLMGPWLGCRQVLREKFAELVQKGRQRGFVVCRDGYNFAITALSEVPSNRGHSFRVKQVRLVQNEQATNSGKLKLFQNPFHGLNLLCPTRI